MNTNEPAACGTCPSFLFLFDELSYATLLYAVEIVEHAHPVFCSVALVEPVYHVARVFPAIEAIPQISSLEHFTLLYPALSPGFGLPVVVDPATRACVLFPDIGAAEAAVHPAGRDQIRRY